MAYKIEPTVLRDVTAAVLDLPLDTGQRFAALIEALADRYPDVVADEVPRWMMSKAGGVLGKISFLYMGPSEYLLIFGSPAATDGYTGRYRFVDVHKVVLAGRYVTYDLESDQIAPTVLLPGDTSHMRRGEARGLQIDSGSWHLEYGRGVTMTAMPFAMMDTLVNSMALKPVLATTKEYLRFTARGVRRRFRKA
jgi:hypothetical protein